MVREILFDIIILYSFIYFVIMLTAPNSQAEELHPPTVENIPPNPADWNAISSFLTMDQLITSATDFAQSHGFRIARKMHQ